MIENIEKKIYEGDNISENEAIILSELQDKENLYKVANRVREFFKSDVFDMCTITNAKSGSCTEDCKWCAQSASYETGVATYEIVDKNQAIEQASINRKYGVNRYSLVTSGRVISKKNLSELCEIYGEIKKNNDISLCASMGLLNEEKLLMLKNAGIVHYHCNLETSREFFPQVCTTHTYEEKIQTIRTARKLGMKICSGGIIGMGETMLDRIRLAMELQKLEVDSIPINILSPVAGTPLENSEKLSDDEILTTIALFRLINPKADIRFAGGRMQISHIQDKALKAGVNSALVGDLLTTIGTNVNEDIKIFKDAGFRLNDLNN